MSKHLIKDLMKQTCGFNTCQEEQEEIMLYLFYGYHLLFPNIVKINVSIKT